MTLGDAVAMVAPFYNFALAIISAILFFKVFSYGDKKFAYIKPWKIMFFGFIVFVVETIMTLLRGQGMIQFHPAIFPLFEMIVVTSFIYMLLLQKQYVKTGKKE